MTWLSVFRTALWVLGLAIIVASLGWRLWQFRLHLSQPGDNSIGIFVDVGGLLFCIGISLGASESWSRLLFPLLACAFTVMAIVDLRSITKEHN